MTKSGTIAGDDVFTLYDLNVVVEAVGSRCDVYDLENDTVGRHRRIMRQNQNQMADRPWPKGVRPVPPCRPRRAGRRRLRYFATGSESMWRRRCTRLRPAGPLGGGAFQVRQKIAVGNVFRVDLELAREVRPAAPEVTDHLLDAEMVIRAAERGEARFEGGYVGDHPISVDRLVVSARQMPAAFQQTRDAVSWRNLDPFDRRYRSGNFIITD